VHAIAPHEWHVEKRVTTPCHRVDGGPCSRLIHGIGLGGRTNMPPPTCSAFARPKGVSSLDASLHETFIDIARARRLRAEVSARGTLPAPGTISATTTP